ncbi:GNAT family N-acetyltransferase [Mobilicoccus caccae]
MLRAGTQGVACARLGTGRRWAHVSCVEVRPEARGAGLARGLMSAAISEATANSTSTSMSTTTTGPRVEPASFAAVEVEADNAPARRLYETMGFALHHRYHYRRPVGP